MSWVATPVAGAGQVEDLKGGHTPRKCKDDAQTNCMGSPQSNQVPHIDYTAEAVHLRVHEGPYVLAPGQDAGLRT